MWRTLPPIYLKIVFLTLSSSQNGLFIQKKYIFLRLNFFSKTTECPFIVWDWRVPFKMETDGEHTCWVSFPTGCLLGDILKRDFLATEASPATGTTARLEGGVAAMTTLVSVSLWASSSSSSSASSSSSLSWCSRSCGPPWSRWGRWSSSMEMTRRRGHPSGGPSRTSSSTPAFFSISAFFALTLSFPVTLFAPDVLLGDLLAFALTSYTLGGAGLA